MDARHGDCNLHLFSFSSPSIIEGKIIVASLFIGSFLVRMYPMKTLGCGLCSFDYDMGSPYIKSLTLTVLREAFAHLLWGFKLAITDRQIKF